MENNFFLKFFTGENIKALIPEIARLRINVFSGYPFFYDGDLAYEEKYLKKFLKMSNALVIAIFNKKQIIGVATAFPFIFECSNLKKVFINTGLNPKDFFCIGEIALEKPYQKKGLGSRCLEEIELFVKNLQIYPHLCLYTRQQSFEETEGQLSPDTFWKKHHFIKHPELCGEIFYKEKGYREETPHKMVFWIKDLDYTYISTP